MQEYVPPFSFEVEGMGLDKTQGTKIHDIIFLVYKQRDGQVCKDDEYLHIKKQILIQQINMSERQRGCNPGMASERLGIDYNDFVEKYNLELVAGNFLWTTYTPGTDTLLCYFTKCTGDTLPFPLPGINDGPRCTQ